MQSIFFVLLFPIFSRLSLLSANSPKLYNEKGLKEEKEAIAFREELLREAGGKLILVDKEKKKETIVRKNIPENINISMEDLNKLYYRLEMKQIELFHGLKKFLN